MQRFSKHLIILLMTTQLVLANHCYAMKRENVSLSTQEEKRELARNFRKAITSGHRDLLQYLIVNPDLNINSQTIKGDTFLHTAVERWCAWVKDAEFAAHNFGLGTGLMRVMPGDLAIYQMHARIQEQIMQLLLAHKARIDIPNKALKLPFENNPVLYVKLIRDPIIAAIKTSDITTIQRFLNQGINVNEDLHGDSDIAHKDLLIVAACENNPEVLQCFLDNKADLLGAFPSDANNLIPRICALARLAPTMLQHVYEHVPLPCIKEQWNTHAPYWIMIAKEIHTLSKDVKLLIAQYYACECAIIKQKERLAALNAVLLANGDQALDIEQFAPLWHKRCLSALANRPQKLAVGLITTNTLTK